LLRRLAIGFSAVPLLLGGCAALRDAVIRERLLDHRFYRDIGPALMDSYRMKMENKTLPHGPAEPAPDGLDLG
jgi:hypothetical protein